MKSYQGFVSETLMYPQNLHEPTCSKQIPEQMGISPLWPYALSQSH